MYRLYSRTGLVMARPPSTAGPPAGRRKTRTTARTIGCAAGSTSLCPTNIGAGTVTVGNAAGGSVGPTESVFCTHGNPEPSAGCTRNSYLPGSRASRNEPSSAVLVLTHRGRHQG